MSHESRIFLLSPATCTGRRARSILSGASSWDGMASLRRGRLTLGELFTFLSGLYFRGKLAYAQRFAASGPDSSGVFVITATDGLLRPDALVSLDDLARYAGAHIAADEPRFRGPLVRDASRLAALHPGADFVLLGSIATEKYVEPLRSGVGPRLRFPDEFVGMGDMSRGSVLLGCAERGEELSYRSMGAGPRRGPRRTLRTLGALAAALALGTVGGCAPDADDAATASRTASAQAATPTDGAPGLTRAPIPDSAFVRLVEELSEDGGYFDTDNLVSNERSYLHVAGALGSTVPRGGAYLGVGPDQNFSYAAILRPEVAYIVDIRRDNLLQHLWFKALFELAPTRVEYLSLMLGRPPPLVPADWAAATVDELVGYVDGRTHDPAVEAEAWERIGAAVAETGVPLTPADAGVIRSIVHRFAEAGLDLRFTSHYRGPRPYYPTYRDLLLETDLDGARASYLSDEERYRFLRTLQLENRIIPVVGDLAGDHAIRAIGDDVRRAGLRVTAFYTSNVEFYLMRNGTFAAFARNVTSLPRASGSVIVRSYFDRFAATHPQAVPGYPSVQLVHPLEDFEAAFEAGGFSGYWDLVTRDSAPLR